MEPIDLLRILVTTLEGLGIDDLVTGSMATIGRQFNIIHFASGLKIDASIPKADDFERSRQQRARALPVGPDWTARFASPEDVILRKLRYYQMGGSDKHLRDIAGCSRSRDPASISPIWRSGPGASEWRNSGGSDSTAWPGVRRNESCATSSFIPQGQRRRTPRACLVAWWWASIGKF